MSNPRRISKKPKDVADETIDIDTFKAWLSGVEDMQGDDWTPSAEQWKKIRSKINLLTVPEYEDPKPQYPVYRQPQIGNPGYAPIAPPVTTMPVYQQPIPSALASRPQLGPQGALPGFSAPNAGSGSTALVPDNLSDAPYESSFG